MATYIEGEPVIADPVLDTTPLVKLEMDAHLTLKVYQWSGSAWVLRP